MSKFIEHITKSNERWDTIAYQYYGDAKNYEPIINANPYIKADPVLNEGTKLYIPIDIKFSNNSEEIVPWKQ